MYNEYIKCTSITKYNTIKNNFYIKLYEGYLNIKKSEHYIDIISKLLKKF